MSNPREFSHALIAALCEMNIHALNVILGESGHDQHLHWSAESSYVWHRQSDDGWTYRFDVLNKLTGRIIGGMLVRLGYDGSLVAHPVPRASN